MNQPAAPRLVKVALGSVGIRQGKATLRLRLCLDQIRQRFRCGQVKLAVQESSTRKLAGFCMANAIQPGQCPQQCRDRRPATMNLKFGDVLAREAMGAGKEQDQPVIDWTLRSFQRCVNRPSCGRNAPQNRFEGESSMWA